MAKRFGRNQKRKMRLEIESQNSLLAKQAREIKELNRNLSCADNTIKLTAEILGEHFISLPVQNFRVKEIQNLYQYAIKPAHPERYLTSRHLEFCHKSLVYLETYQAEASIDKLRQLVHMRYFSQCGKVAYGLPKTVWDKLPAETLEKIIRTDIAQEMAHLLVKHGQEKRGLRFY